MARTIDAALLAAQKANTADRVITLTVGGVDYSARLDYPTQQQEQPYGGLATVRLTNHDKGITGDLRGQKVVFGFGFEVGTVETLRPNAAGDEANIAGADPAVAHYLNVDEAVADEDATYLYTTTDTYERDLYNLPAHSASGVISKVTVYARARYFGAGGGTRACLKLCLKSGGTAYESSAQTIALAYANYSNTWSNNPQTGLPWTWTDIDALQIGVSIRDSVDDPDDNATLVTQVWAEVTYGNVSHPPSYWVLSQRAVTESGVNDIELVCIDIWQKLRLLPVTGGAGVKLDGTITGSFRAGEKVTGSSSGTTAYVIGSGIAYLWVGNVANGPFTAADTVTGLDGSLSVDTVTDLAGGSIVAWDGDKTILEIIQQLTTGVVTIVQETDDGIVNTLKPTYTCEIGKDIASIIQDLMSLTKSVIRAEEDDKLHIYSLVTDPVAADYTYGTDHSCYKNIVDTSAVLPNKVIAINAKQIGTGVTPYSGEANDVPAQTQFGLTITRILFTNAQSDAQALIYAQSELRKAQMEASQGQVEVPMSTNEELFDYIAVADPISDATTYGYVGGITRIIGPGYYRTVLDVGGLTRAVPLPTFAQYPAQITPKAVVPQPNNFLSTVLTFLPAYLPAAINIDFSATDNDDIAWTSGGTIICADGTTFTITADAGNVLNLANANPYYLYYDTAADSHALSNTQTFSAALGAEKILVAFALKNATTTEKATIVPGTGGKNPTIAANAIYVSKLSAITADMGLLTAGEIRVGTGTLGSNFTGWRFWVESSVGRMAGYASDVIQWYSDTDGKLYAGAGAVILDVSGLLVKTNTAFGVMPTAGFKVQRADDATKYGWLYIAKTAVTSKHYLALLNQAASGYYVGEDSDAIIDALTIELLGGYNVSIEAGTTNPTPAVNYTILVSSLNGISIDAGSAPSDPSANDLILEGDDQVWVYAPGGIVLHDDALTEELDGVTDNFHDIGATSNYDDIYCNTLHYNGGTLPDNLDDIALIKQLRTSPDDKSKLLISSLPDFLKYNKQKYMAKAEAKIDAVDAKHRTHILTKLESVKRKRDSAKEQKVIKRADAVIAKLQDMLNLIGSDKAEKMLKWEQRFQYVSEHFLPLNQTLALTMGALRQLITRVEELEAKVKESKGV